MYTNFYTSVHMDVYTNFHMNVHTRNYILIYSNILFVNTWSSSKRPRRAERNGKATREVHREDRQ